MGASVCVPACVAYEVVVVKRSKLRSGSGVGSSHRPKWDRSLGLTVFTGLAMLVVLGLVFSVAYGSQQITSSAAALHDADEGLRAATIVRAQLALGVHMSSVDREFGTNSGEAQETSTFEATLAMEDLSTAVEQLLSSGKVSDERLVAATDALAVTNAEIVGLLVSGDSDGAQLVSESRLDPEFRELTAVLVSVRDALSEEVSSSDALLGRIGNFARYLVAFLIPAAVILVYRELMKRQARQAELETRLNAERQLNAAREEFVANASHELRTPHLDYWSLDVVGGERGR